MGTDRLKVRELEIVLRNADGRDEAFAYELMRNGLGNLFEQIAEGWSREKFRRGYHPERITVIEHEGMPIGFADLEILGEEAYFHNLHISRDYQNKGLGPAIGEFIEEKAQKSGAISIKAKVFTSNQKSLRFLARKGYEVIGELPEEKSRLIRKNLNGPKIGEKDEAL